MLKTNELTEQELKELKERLDELTNTPIEKINLDKELEIFSDDEEFDYVIENHILDTDEIIADAISDYKDENDNIELESGKIITLRTKNFMGH